MYVLVRRDLLPIQQTVQACHAALEAARTFLGPHQPHPSLVICGVRDGPRLVKSLDALHQAGIRFCTFHEPDLGDELTAAATEPVLGKQRQYFQRFQLLGIQGC